MNESADPSCYHVYVLRLWREPTEAEAQSATWRFVLQAPQTGQRRGFTSFGALMAFLESELQPSAPLEG